MFTLNNPNKVRKQMEKTKEKTERLVGLKSEMILCKGRTWFGTIVDIDIMQAPSFNDILSSHSSNPKGVFSRKYSKSKEMGIEGDE